MTRDEVVDDARKWLTANTCFVHQAAKLGVGADCIGLVGGIARDRGTPEGLAWDADATVHAYNRTPVPRMLLKGALRYLDPITPAEVTVADIVLMRIRKDPQHFAIVSRIDPTYIIHASTSAGRVVENRLDEKWRSRIVRAFRYRGIR